MKKHAYLTQIEEICKNNHLKVEDIFEILKKTYPNVWLATVYRWVNYLVQQWKMRKIENIDKTAYYETVTNPHIHFIDEETWKIFDIPLDKISVDAEIVGDISDIRIIWKLKKA